MSICVHTLVKNEARFIWYAVMSVVDYVEKIIIWDTGSTDGTVEIIEKLISSPKTKNTEIIFKRFINVSFNEEKLRQQMLDFTFSDWILIVDGDEIWWDHSIRKISETIREKGKDLESIVVPTINLVGDIYHYQEEKAGNYNLSGKRGHLNLRATNRNIDGLHSVGGHGVWGWVDDKGRMVQNRDPKNMFYLDAPYLHATYLRRSGDFLKDKEVFKRKSKRKHELGISLPQDYYYPEVFFREKPEIIPSPWEKIDKNFWFISLVETPLRKIKRRILPARVGY